MSCAGFAAYFAYRSESRAVVSVVAHRLERAFEIGALVFGTIEADSAFVGPAAAIAASLYSRAVVIVVALRFERASAMEASMFGTIEADSAFVGPAAAFAASVLTTFGCGVSRCSALVAHSEFASTALLPMPRCFA